MTDTIDPTAFVHTVSPFLRANDTTGLVGLLRSRWTPGQIADLLAEDDDDARKVAALSLALVGHRPAVDALCPLLSDADPMVQQMAEHAMWSIWFRLGSTPAANDSLCRGAQAVARRDLDRGMAHFTAAATADPKFAEAYNQRALAHFMLDEHELSLADCRRAVALMPCHFGAWAGMGHCHLHLGHLRNALRAYRKALAIHPHMDGVYQVATEICRQLREEEDGAGDGG